MTYSASHQRCPTILLIGGSRGLGLAIAAEFLKKGWNAAGSVQDSARTELHDLADENPSRLEIETLEITEPDQITALHYRSFHILFRNAGIVPQNTP